MSLRIAFSDCRLAKMQWGNVHALPGGTVFQVTEQFNTAWVTGTILAAGSGSIDLVSFGGSEVTLVATNIDSSDAIILRNADNPDDLHYISRTSQDPGDFLTFTETDLGDFMPCTPRAHGSRRPTGSASSKISV